MSDPKNLGVMRPIGGGDPIPLKKTELLIGRRPSADIRLDFENVSGKHCVLRYINGTWHVRDLGSTNGTSLNGRKLNNEHGVMPDDELAIASHLFTLDYEPSAPLFESQLVLEEELESRKAKSLMELAGLESDERPRTRRPAAPAEPAPRRRTGARSVDEDAVSSTNDAPIGEDDFFKMIEDDIR